MTHYFQQRTWLDGKQRRTSRVHLRHPRSRWRCGAPLAFARCRLRSSASDAKLPANTKTLPHSSRNTRLNPVYYPQIVRFPQWWRLPAAVVTFRRALPFFKQLKGASCGKAGKTTLRLAVFTSCELRHQPVCFGEQVPRVVFGVQVDL